MKLSWKIPPATATKDKIIRVLCCLGVVGLTSWDFFEGRNARTVCHIVVAAVWFYLAVADPIPLLLRWARRRKQKPTAEIPFRISNQDATLLVK
jgi:hypothetical protein